MEQKPSEITAALDDFLAPWLFPDKGDGSDPRLCPACGEGRLALRGGRFGAFVACSNYPECKFTRRFGQGGEEGGEDAGRRCSASDPETGAGGQPAHRPLRALCPARRGQGGEARLAAQGRARRPTSTSTWRCGCCRCRAPSATIPRRGKPITASIGRYGPYLAHDGKYAKLASTAEVFEIGMNAAVAKLADAAARRRPARGLARAAQGARRASAHRGRDQADGGPLRPLCHRRHDQRDLAQVARAGRS